MSVGSIPLTGPRAMVPHVGLLNTELSTLYASRAQLLGSVAGTNSIIAVASPTVLAYDDGNSYYLVPFANNTGNVTLNVDSLGAKEVVLHTGSQIPPDGLRAGGVYLLVYQNNKFWVVSGGAAAGGGFTEYEWVHADDGNSTAIDFISLGEFSTIEISGRVGFAAAAASLFMDISEDGLSTTETNLRANLVDLEDASSEIDITNGVAFPLVWYHGATADDVWFNGRITNFNSADKESVVNCTSKDDAGHAYTLIGAQIDLAALDSIRFRLSNAAAMTSGHITVRGIA